MSYFETRFTPDKKRAVVWKELTRHIASRFQMGDQVLDLGCGYGDFINNVNAAKRFAVDLSPDAERHLDPAVSFLCGPVPDVLKRFSDQQFSFVFSSNLLEHLTREQIDVLFVELKRVLKPGGSVGILMPNYRRASQEYFDDFTHLTPLSDSSLPDWAASHGFKLKFMHPGFMPYSMKNSRLPVTSWLVRAWIISPWKPGGKQMLAVFVKG